MMTYGTTTYQERSVLSVCLSFFPSPPETLQLALRPSQLVLGPSQLALRPSQLALRPSQLVPRLTQLDPRPSQRCSSLSLS